MANSIVTSLELQIAGSQRAISALNATAAASRQVAISAESGGMGVNRLGRALGSLAGVGGNEFKFLGALTESITGAEKGWSNLARSVGNAALWAGAAAGIGLVINQAKSLSDEIDKLYEGMGREPQGFWSNVAQGTRILAGLEDASPGRLKAISDDETSAGRAANRTAEGKTFLREANRTNSPDELFAKWVEENSDELTRNDTATREAMMRAAYDEIKAQVELEKESTSKKQAALRRTESFWEQLAEQVEEELFDGKAGPAQKFADKVQSGDIPNDGLIELRFKKFAEAEKQAADAAEQAQRKIQKDRLDQATQDARQELDARRTTRTDEMRFLTAPRFASGSTTSGSADAYNLIATSRAQAAGAKDTERLQREQLEEAKQQTAILNRLINQKLAVFSIN